jgi:hypothetical protein
MNNTDKPSSPALDFVPPAPSLARCSECGAEIILQTFYSAAHLGKAGTMNGVITVWECRNAELHRQAAEVGCRLVAAAPEHAAHSARNETVQPAAALDDPYDMPRSYWEAADAAVEAANEVAIAVDLETGPWPFTDLHAFDETAN